MAEASFAAPGVEVMNEEFTGNPSSISLRVTEDDGSGNSNDDGACWIRLRPAAFPVGIAEYDCLPQGDNGLALKWIIMLRINSFIPPL